MHKNITFEVCDYQFVIKCNTYESMHERKVHQYL